MEASVIPHTTNMWSSTWLEHALLTLLLTVGAVRAVSTGAWLLAMVPAVVAFLGWYAVGIRLARRSSSARPPAKTRAGFPGASSGQLSTELGPEFRAQLPTRPGSAAIGWLAVLILLWALLVLTSAAFAWVAFSLWLLIGHFLSLTRGLLLSLAVLAVVLWATNAHGTPTLASILGPTIGALFAVVISRGRHQLIRDDLERQRLVDSLLRAQAESEVLSTELAAAQRESGVLAERTRLSRDIHDGLAQSFSSILLTARSATRDDPAAVTETLRLIETSAREGLEESRRVVGALAPQGLADIGLTASLGRLLATLSEQTSLQTELHVEGLLTSLPTTLEVALLRVAQGGLANVRQHSGASRVVVSLTDAGDTVRLDIVDDGRGFDPATPRAQSASHSAGGGYGLRSSRDRLRALGGGLDIESRTGEGTALTAYVPLRTAHRDDRGEPI